MPIVELALLDRNDTEQDVDIYFFKQLKIYVKIK